MYDKTWVYVFVRTDLPLQQQMVQSNHAALEAGHKFEKKAQDPSSLIMIQVSNKEQLIKAMEKVREAGVRVEEFHEPDWDYGLTAFATEPVPVEQRLIFKKYRLWKAQA